MYKSKTNHNIINKYKGSNRNETKREIRIKVGLGI